METRVIQLIESFCRSFDDKDWAQMAACLKVEIETDYSSFRGASAGKISAGEYVALRKTGLAGLRTLHRTTDYAIFAESGKIRCQCRFEIQRFQDGTKVFFHSFGTYIFEVEEEEELLKISRIRQTVERNEGDPGIHGAFRQ